MKSPLALLFLASMLSYSVAQTQIATTPPFVAQLYVPNVTRPRSLILDLAGDVLLTHATQSRITGIREVNNGNGTVTVTTRIIVDAPGLGLNHGLAFYGGFLYASNPTTVFRWPYTPGSFQQIAPNQQQIVVQGIPSVQGHTTRTLSFDRQGRLYIAIGTQTDANPSPHRSRILRFNNLANQFLPIPFGNGEVFAHGCRNTVGLGFNLNDVLFGVDMGADQLNRPDVGAIWGDNPGDEMNKHDLPTNRHFGFPDCWSVYRLTGTAPSTQFAWPFAGVNLGAMDTWCRNPANNVPPLLSFPAHSSPMSISFYDGTNCGVNGGFPCTAVDEAFVTFRGSWHAGIPHGYRVTWYRFNRATETPTGEAIEVIFAPNAVNSCNACLRPAGATFNSNGHLLVSADTTGQIFRVAHNTVLPTVINVTL